MSKKKPNPRDLLLTEAGGKWLEQIPSVDRETAERVVSNLTLVSHSEFQRCIQKNLESVVNETKGAIALYAVRETDPTQMYFDQVTNSKTGGVDALSSGNDHGSEAIIANLIRNYCKTNPRKLLNHPSMAEMKKQKCRSIIFVDDFIGSGQRTRKFIQAFWNHRSLRSWHSFKYFKFTVIAYCGTENGMKYVAKHKASPSIFIERQCPSFKDMSWGQRYADVVINFFKKYGHKTCKKNYPLGYDRVMASIVFEHGCPNNVPAIFWAPSSKKAPWCSFSLLGPY